MKKIALAMLFVFLAGLIPAYAEEDVSLESSADAELTFQDETTVDVGTTPDKAGYGLKIALEKIRFALTFNKQDKAELALRLAGKRLEEAKVMAKENKIEALARAKEEHRKLIEKAKVNLQVSGEDEEDLEEQSEIEVEIEGQESKLEDLENFALIKAKGLTDEQRQKLLALMEEFRNQNAEIRLKVAQNKQEIKVRLKAKGLNETELEGREQKLEENLERFASHQVNQSEKMLELASALIVKAQTNANITIKQETLDLKAKAGAKLSEAKLSLSSKEFEKAVDLARESKKLSALTIASIRGLEKDLIENKLERIKESEELREKLKEQLEERREQLKEEKDKVREGLKERLEKIKENSGSEDDEDENDDEED